MEVENVNDIAEVIDEGRRIEEPEGDVSSENTKDSLNAEKESSEESSTERETAETAENTSANRRVYPTQVVLSIRAIVGAYVLYLTYQIMTSGDEKSVLMYIAVALLAISGVVILGITLKMLILGEYEGGKKDLLQDSEANSRPQSSGDTAGGEDNNSI